MTIVAVVLAALAACVFGIAATAQHGAVRQSVAAERRLVLADVSGLVRDRRWLAGIGLLVVGTALHVAALALAPISVVQPLNVLAVPTTVVVAALSARRAPSRRSLVGVVAVVVGLAAAVIPLSSSASGTTPTDTTLALTAAAVVLVTVVLHLISAPLTRRHSRGRAWIASVLLGAAGALDYAVASSCFRLLAQSFDGSRVQNGVTVVLVICAVPLALVAGSWSIHQAYAAGAAAAVTATSALTDPIVAVGLGVAVLGERLQVSPAGLAAVLVGGALAAYGVISLARLDDETRRSGADDDTGSPRRRTGSSDLTDIEEFRAHPAGR